jgi:hypothetical protein
MNRIANVVASLFVIVNAIPTLAHPEVTQITVRLFNRSSVTVPVINDAESQAGEILRYAAIHVSWLNCEGSTQECTEAPSTTNLILTISKQAAAMGDTDALGMAVQDRTGSGAYGYVFEDKLNEISGKFHIHSSRLLAYALAHEIGHLLKGSHSHSGSGIMSASWSSYELEQLSRGALRFTDKDSEIMHSRLRRLGRIQSVAKVNARY